MRNDSLSGGVLLGSPEGNRLRGNKNNQVLPVDLQADGALNVSVAYQTIQSIGPHAGWPAVFVRLQGCDLACHFCDADYRLEPENERSTPAEVVALCKRMVHPGALAPFVVITGGEPFRQNIVPLVNLLVAEGAVVEIETHGSLWLEDFPVNDEAVSLLVSPKLPELHPKIHEHAAAFVYVVRHGEMGPDGMPDVATQVLAMAPPARPAREDVPIYVVPMYEEGEMPPAPDGQVPNVSLLALNTRAAVQGAMVFGHRISLQINKILGLQ